MSKFILLLSLFFCVSGSFAQHNMRTLEVLLDKSGPGWSIVKKWIDSAKNKVEVLSVDSVQAKEALYQTQVTTRSPMGAIIYFTGGILIDNGWIRILGSGNKKISRTLPGWNKGKSFESKVEAPGFLLIADDVVGGFFAINAGKLEKENFGKVYYLSPDRLEWENLDLTYTDFLLFCFSGDLVKFYGAMRWPKWEKEIASLNGDEVFNFAPPLWTKDGKDIKKNSKKTMPVEEQYEFNMMMRKQLNLDKENN